MNVILSVKGTDFAWNGQKRLLHMATSFGWLGLIRQRRFREAKQWLERMANLGMDGIRVFGEYRDWQHNFFFAQVPALYDVWDWSAPRGSKVVITKTNQKVLTKAIEFLQEFDMIMEYSVSATVKAFSNELIPGYRDHMCRAIAQWFAGYEQFHGATNTLFEVENEYDTVELKKRLTANEIDDIARRFRVRRPENNPPLPDFPGGLLGISEGGEGAGKWDIAYDPENFSHVNIHSPRGRNWERVGSEVDRFLVKYKKPVYLNENNHFMSEEEWDEWIPQIPNWEGLSTKNAKGIIRQAEDAFRHGASYCLHFMTGMLTDPGRDLTRVEEMWKEAFNPVVDTPPLSPPPPPPPGDKTEPGWKKVLYGIWYTIRKIF